MSEEKKAIVSIRGVSEELYSKAVSLAKNIGVPVGEVVNEALRLLLSTIELGVAAPGYVLRSILETGRRTIESITNLGNVIKVGDMEELTVSRRDLESVEGKVIFSNIKRLVFSNDVTPELFESKVHSIVFCDVIVIPEAIPKMKVLSKARLVKRVEISGA